MDKLLRYLNALPKSARAPFCASCGTSEGYLRKGISKGQLFSGSLCIAIERETNGEVTCEDLDPNTDWAFLRATTAPQLETHAGPP